MNTYPHMCRDGHQEIGHADSEHEQCPLCRVMAEVERLRGLLREWHDKDWKRTASLCLPKNHLVLRTRAALAPTDQPDAAT